MLLYPVNLAISGQLCLVIGGGRVATRKVESLLFCSPLIRVIAPEVGERIRELAEAGRIQWERRTYQQGELAGARLVFAATNLPEVQEQIVAEANEAGIPVNVVTRPEACTFQVPASLRRGDLLITVATGGGSPALASRIRKELELRYGDEYGRLVALMAAIRREVVSLNGPQAEHKRIFEKILDGDILDHIRNEDWEAVEGLLHKFLPSSIGISDLVEGVCRG